MVDKRPTVSVVVPAYNEADRLGHTLPRLRTHMAERPGTELVIVDDGSSDGTADLAERALADTPGATVLRLPWNRGKGAAIRAGVSAARGDRLAFMDADLSADLGDLDRLVAALDDADVVLGSRELASSHAVYDSRVRRVSSKVFNDVACLMAHLSASDTQCGFKAFHTPVAKMLFDLAVTDGFAFDVEVLALARMLGYQVAEVPVSWVERPGSRVRPLRDPVRMLVDVVRTRRRCDEVRRLLGPDAARRLTPSARGATTGPRDPAIVDLRDRSDGQATPAPALRVAERVR